MEFSAVTVVGHVKRALSIQTVLCHKLLADHFAANVYTYSMKRLSMFYKNRLEIMGKYCITVQELSRQYLEPSYLLRFINLEIFA